MSNYDFAHHEFSELSFGDERLNARAPEVIKMLNGSPGHSFPSAAESKRAELKGLYRFFNNIRVTDQAMLQTHYSNTVMRMSQCPNEILLITDSTFMAPTKKKTMNNLKDMGKGKGNGLRIHYMIAVDNLTGDVLGITSLKTIGADLSETDARLGDESDLWKIVAEDTFNQINAGLSEKEAKHLIARCTYMADREGDDYDLLLCIRDYGFNFITRSQYDRKLTDPEDGNKYKISDFEEEEILQGKPYKITVQENGKSRDATVQRSTLKSVELNPPDGQSNKDKLEISITIVREVDPPQNVKSPVEWRLLSSHFIKNKEDSKDIVERYCKRWKIEEMNKCAKSGVKLEERQFTKFENICPVIASIFVVAWRILYIRDLARKKDETPIEEVFDEEEVGYFNGVVLPKLKKGANVSVQDALDHIARLGGYLGGYKNPGWYVLWEGWFKFSLLSRGFTIGINYKKKSKTKKQKK
jgi:hypothetical protein